MRLITQIQLVGKMELKGHTTAEDLSRIENMRYLSPKGDQPQKYEQINAMTREFARLICELCPPSRQKALALTKLEESKFWANASIVCM